MLTVHIEADVQSNRICLVQKLLLYIRILLNSCQMVLALIFINPAIQLPDPESQILDQNFLNEYIKVAVNSND